MGSDYYESSDRLAENNSLGRPRIGVGAGSEIDGAIIDKNCRIGSGVRIVNDANHTDFNGEHGCVVRDGVIVMPKNTVAPEGWQFG